MIVDGMLHAGLTVSNLERSLEFYVDGLGLELRHRQDQENAYTSQLIGYPGARLRVAHLSVAAVVSGPILELIEYARPQGERVDLATANPGIAHVSFSVQRIDELWAALEARGGRFISDPVEVTEGINQGGRAVYLRDPDGFTVELFESPAERVARSPS